MSVNVDVRDQVLIATLSNPPVNALGASVRGALADAMKRAASDGEIVGVVVTGEGAKAFSGGADINEFGKAPTPPLLPDLLKEIEAMTKPVIAAVNGFALGGGLELALSASARIASPRASFALPEVKLGLIPGAGGTQRLPRVIGVACALEMITTGKKIDTKAALRCGLIEEICADGDLIDEAIKRVRAAAGKSVARDDAPVKLSAEDIAEIEKAESRAKKSGRLSAQNAVAAVRAASELALDEGLQKERALFVECLNSDQRKGMIHAFFAERAAAKNKILIDAAPRPVSIVSILGSGTMGRGIAISFADAGYRVKLYDTSEKALSACRDAIAKHYDGQTQKSRLSAADAEERVNAIAYCGEMDDLADADLYIEAVIEDMEVKKQVFSSLDALAKKGAVLASNTSYLDINEIAAATKRPQDVIGMHFFSPANIMRLLEVVKADKASGDALATAFDVGKRLGKVCAMAGVGDGFIGNRIFKKYRQEAEYIIEDGALPQDVDRVMREFGFAMGPFQVADLAGIDIGYFNRRREDASRDPQERYVDIADKLYEAGRLGQKTGAGWYRYEGRAANPDPEVEALIIDASARKGIERRKIEDEEIRERLLLRMINEGAHLLEEGIAARASDIDIVFIKGYGFPDYRGGPMFYADQLGLGASLAKIEAFAKAGGAKWDISPLLRRLAQENGTFNAAG